jgi:hypothetical protein
VAGSLFRERGKERIRNPQNEVVHSAMQLRGGIIMMGCPGLTTNAQSGRSTNAEREGSAKQDRVGERAQITLGRLMQQRLLATI